MIANHTPTQHTTTVFLLLAVLLAIGCGSEPPDLPTEPVARVTVDLDGGRIVAERGDQRLDASLPPSTPGILEELRATLAGGGDDAQLRSRAGSALLDPVGSVLRGAPVWIWRDAGTGAVPGLLSTLPAWTLPWQPEVPVAAEHTVHLDWPADLAAPVPRAAPPSTADRLLLVAPFREGFEPHHDDSDTLRLALRAAVAHVDQLPRNDTSAPALRRTLEDDQHSWVWLRAALDSLGRLRPAFGALPSAVVWTLPGDLDPGTRPALAPTTFASGGSGPALVVVASWPVPETTLGRLVRPWMELVTRGVRPDLALTEARREAIRAGWPVSVWSALMPVGLPGATAPPARATWLRRRLGSDG